MESIKNQAFKLPAIPGVYFFRDSNEEIIYVGKSINVQERVLTHLASIGNKSKSMVAFSSRVESISVNSELEALLLEAQLIKRFLPKYNSRAKDDKHPLYIKITKKDEYPKVLTSRVEDDKKSVYFGPFPSSSIVKKVLRQIRKVFPYCTQKSITGRPCLYSHINLCNPCPSYIVKVEDPCEQMKLKKIYKENINGIINLLSGKKTNVRKAMEKQMENLSKKENFEEAAKSRNQLLELDYITQPFNKPIEYMSNPNLAEDLRDQEIENLYKLLKDKIKNLKMPKRIECFDVSHLQGTFSTSSMVTFIDGFPEKRFYRQFKIYGQKTNDDFYMMNETIKRRLKHLENWGVPDLIVVDGGKPQITAARKAFTDCNADIPLIGLAKRFETIIIFTSSKFIEITLGRNEPALNLLQRIRDEAHRFARKYHFKLRMKRY